MDCGIYYTKEIYFSKETFNSKYEVESRIKNLEHYSKSLRDSLLSLSLMTEPKKMLNIEDGINASDVVITKFNESIDKLIGIQLELNDLRSLMDDWDQCHIDKDGIKVVKNFPEGFNPYLSEDPIKDELHDSDLGGQITD